MRNFKLLDEVVIRDNPKHSWVITYLDKDLREVSLVNTDDKIPKGPHLIEQISMDKIMLVKEYLIGSII